MRDLSSYFERSEQRNDASAPVKEPLELALDWDAYFERFKEVHGEPVRYRQRLLFQDGWTYSARDKAGPEYPPPTDARELHRLQTAYWLARLNLVTTERNFLRDTLQDLRRLQREHSLPLQHSALIRDDSGAAQRITQAIDLDELEQGRLVWLERDVVDCQTQLADLQR